MIEFFIGAGISDVEAERMIGTDAKLDKTTSQEWHSSDGNAQALRIETDKDTEDPFDSNVINEVCF